MLRLIRESSVVKAICVFLALSLVVDILHPYRLLALTGGPSQPEVESFSPVTNTDMVDLFSGDFKYNINLMTIPGPNGGYPINLVYNGGPGMEQEASWVGLGWNLNAGCITRQMRGVPDDFNGNQITKTYSKRANSTYGLFLDDINCELIGLDFFKSQSASAQLYYNTYKGLGVNVGLGVSTVDKRTFSSGLATDIGVNFDSQGGTSPSLSFTAQTEKDGLSGKLGFCYNSRQGLLSMNTGLTLPKINPTGSFDMTMSKGSGMSFGTATYVPPITMPLSGGSIRVAAKLGIAAMGALGDVNIGVSYSTQYIKENNQSFPAYGVMYLENSDENSLKDFNREKDVLINKNSQNLPIPVMTHDIFSVSGEGTGGVFRAFRSDIGYMSDPAVQNNFDGGQLGVDIGTGLGAHVGANIEVNLADGYSGIWQGGFENSIFGYKGNLSVSSPTKAETYEPSYFKMLGEQTCVPTNQMDYVKGYNPIRFDEYKGDDKYPKINNYVMCEGNNYPITHTTRSEREKRDKLIQYYTYSDGINDSVPNGATSSQISQIDIINPDGTTYVYGKPVYNQLQKDVYFSVENDGQVNNWDNEIQYEAQDATIQNKKGVDHLYSCTQTPAYAYSFMLTRIVSPNFVDANFNNKADTNDLGDFVNFEYYKVPTPYKWRVPYKNAYYNANFNSDYNDDKANYTYGEKEICYVERIETRTHYAKFYLSKRHDGVAANQEFNVGDVTVDTNTCGYQMKLDSISLFSWRDTVNPVQTIHFVYSYELCRNVYNNIFCQDSNNYNSSGKLTLKEIWYSYGKNRKGKFSPYQFNYHSNVAAQNPDYSLSKQDRWGTYNPHVFPGIPYVPQFDENLDQYAGAWCLKEITLPSGGKINVGYEADDYAYVQDKQATEMFRINGIGEPGNNKFVNNDIPDLNNRRIYFFLRPGCHDIREYFNGLKEGLVYFKTYTELTTGDWDYVDGYAEIETESNTYGDTVTINGDSVGFITLKGSNVKNNANPIRVAAWQYMKLQRPDLLYPATSEDNALMQVVNIIVSLFNDIATLITGYYSYCIMSNYAKQIIITPTNDLFPGDPPVGYVTKHHLNHPSFIRLNSPGKIKKGGGHRVKEIALLDNWNIGQSSSYTTDYTYRCMENGKVISSGVAEYEPIIGGEEIALRYPIRYSNENSFHKDNELYMEEPFGENYFPAPNVGYSKVIVSTQYPEGVTKSATGSQVTEFYTAKDFPIITKNTTIDNDAKHKPFPIQIPLIGYKTITTQGYTQGYYVELNDMHGKMKTQATYDYGENLLSSYQPEAISKVEYFYKTLGNYNPSGANYLNNTVEVLTADGITTTAKLGESYDFVADLRENSTHTEAYGLLFNIDLAVVAPIPSVTPDIENTDEVFRTAVTNKIVYKNGILSEVRSTTDGSTVQTKNLLFDAQNGTPLLTSVNNEYNKPVYNYNLPSSWSYPGMGSAYKNYKATIYDNSTFQDYLTPGDVIFTNNSYYWLTGFNSGVPVWQDKFSNPITPAYPYKVLSSGYTNQQGVMIGNIVSLTNPVTQRYFPFETAFNDKNNWTDHGSYTLQNITHYWALFNLADCNGSLVPVSVCATNSTDLRIRSNVSDSTCERVGGCFLDIDNFFTPLMTSRDLTHYQIDRQGSNLFISDNLGHTNMVPWNDENGCFNECLDDVLNATATEYTDNIKYDYFDAGIDSVTIPITTMNDYFVGEKGMWRKLRDNAFLVQRKQTGPTAAYSQTNKDGVYGFFNLFEWDVYNGNSVNQQFPWTWTEKTTKFSPYGMELESQNALGIYSGALYGYRNALVTAVSTNARYYETAFDGLEDYTNSNKNYAHGHFKYNTTSILSKITTAKSHTGLRSLYLSPKNQFSIDIPIVSSYAPYTAYSLKLIQGKKYILSFWAYTNGGTLQVKINNGSPLSYAASDPIEGWQRIEVPFIVPSGSTFSFTFNNFDQSAQPSYYLDDIRIQPFESRMKCFVYNEKTQKLTAELDENHYATFYNYDELGKLVQIKKETVRGIVTLKTTRENTSRY